MLEFLLLAVGLVLLVKGADFLIDGAVSLADRWNISKMVVGLTIVAFGTSAPELFINVIAAVNGESDIALGNIVGSNISNIFLVLGIMVIVMNVSVRKEVLNKDIPLSFLAAILLLIFALLPGNSMGLYHGLVLIAFFGLFMYRMIKSPKESFKDVVEEPKIKHPYLLTANIVGGVIGLYIGGRLVVDNAVSIALGFGMSEYVVALTIVAVGTSLPELVTAVVAAAKRQADIGIGNIVGSNIFNILWVLGITAIIRESVFPAFAVLDIAMLLLATILLYIFIRTGIKGSLTRWHGIAMLILYLAYVVSLFLRG